MQEAVLNVAINAPLSRLFDYLPPRHGAPGASPGCRVLVPFGRRRLVGLVMGVAASSDVPAAKLKHALDVLDPAPLLDDSDLELLSFVSAYYHHPIGEVVAAALPAPLRHGNPLLPLIREARLTASGAAVDLDTLTRKAPRQAALLAALRRAGGVATFAALDEAAPGWNRSRKSLEEKGWIEISERQDVSAVRAVSARQAGPALNAGQAAALEAISLDGGFEVTLLDGVTGSGKTEVYLRLIEAVIERGRQALVLVPEIGLTPQLVGRLEQRLGLAPAVLHSSLPDTERLAAWRAARDGSAPLVLGTRSAVFVPLARPGLIVVDEEHDSSFKQQEGLRYSARDLALKRGKALGLPVVLGSATPSLESLHRARDGEWRHLRLPVRAGGAAPPRLALIDLKRYPPEDGLSQPVQSAIERQLAAGGQVLVFINRRGYAPTLICEGCGALAECRHCDARMTVHTASGRLICHHCGASRRLDRTCAECGSDVTPLGHGTQRLESVLRRRFGEHGVARIDSDSTRRRGAMQKALAAAASGESRVLVGTQMLSKGHHFPDLALVCVVDADQGLFSTDFRGTERLAQSIVQVAGRAGREQRRGEVLIQTAFASHPFWAALLGGGYARVADAALEERRAAGWPPFSRLALLRASATDRDLPQRFLETAAAQARAEAVDAVRVLGPVDAPMARRAGRYRAHLLFQSANRRLLHRLLAALLPALEAEAGARRVRWSIDVDPIELF
ncbi:MAG TPA: primosomal protein N' [Woeseiaceae bacterium]